MTIVDSDVWSEALRKRAGKSRSWQVERLESLIRADEVEMLGPIRQEALSGIREEERFQRIRQKLRAYRDGALTSQIHEQAAQFYNLCRSRGIVGSHTDLLICAYSVMRKMTILTKDQDFRQYAQHVPIDLMEE